MSLDAQGKVTALVAQGDSIDAVRARIEEVIPSWEFVPGMLDGTPAATETQLSVRVGLRPSADGQAYAVSVVDVRTGGSVGASKKFSMRLSPADVRKLVDRKIKVAQVAIEVTYDASGKATAAKALDSASPPPQGIAKGVMKSLREWTYVPERVGGVGVPGTVVIPVCFSLAPLSADTRRSSNNCRWNLPGTNAAIDEGQSLALDSRVRLKTDVSGIVL